MKIMLGTSFTWSTVIIKRNAGSKICQHTWLWLFLLLRNRVCLVSSHEGWTWCRSPLPFLLRFTEPDKGRARKSVLDPGTVSNDGFCSLQIFLTEKKKNFWHVCDHTRTNGQCGDSKWFTASTITGSGSMCRRKAPQWNKTTTFKKNKKQNSE